MTLEEKTPVIVFKNISKLYRIGYEEKKWIHLLGKY